MFICNACKCVSSWRNVESFAGAVPKLDISIDQDHMKWLQEQSARHESSSYKPLESELRSQSMKTSNMAKSFTRKKIQQEYGLK